MSQIFTKKGKLDNWYKQKTKELNGNYLARGDEEAGINGVGEVALQRANSISRELEQAKEAINPMGGMTAKTVVEPGQTSIKPLLKRQGLR